MGRHVSIALRLTIVTLVAFGLVYPLAMTGVARVAFPYRSGGSIVWRGGRAIGSELIGQQFNGPGYFHPRPSAAGNGYDARSSGGSNLGPTSRKLSEQVRQRVAEVRKSEQMSSGRSVPADMVTASGSGLDPDISVANAVAQVRRVARARGLPEARVARLVRQQTRGRTFGVLGEPRVNVLQINLALDGLRERHK